MENRLFFYCFLKKKDTFANRFAKVVFNPLKTAILYAYNTAVSKKRKKEEHREK